MKLLPYINRTYTSPFSADYLLRQLQKDIGEQQVFGIIGLFSNSSDPVFEGKVKGNSFSLKRIIYYRNAFNPVIEGMISDTEDGAVIRLTMRLNMFVAVLACIWLSGVSTATILLVADQFHKGKFEPASLVILGFWAFFFGLTNGGFRYEARETDRYFSDLCSAQN